MYRRRKRLIYYVGADVRRLKHYQKRSFVLSPLTSAATSLTELGVTLVRLADCS